MIRINPRIYIVYWFALTGLMISSVYSLIILGAFFHSVITATLCSAIWGALFSGLILKKTPNSTIIIAIAIGIGILSYLTYSIFFTVFYSLFLFGYADFNLYRLESDLIVVMGVGGLLASPAILLGGALSGYLLNKKIIKRENA